MKNKPIFVTLLLLIFGTNSYAQNAYYKVNGGKTINEKSYKGIKKNLAKTGKVEELNLKTITRNDSTVHYIKLGNLMTTPDGIDPWAATKKFIGTRFQIEKYADGDSKNFKSDYLEGKPTFINFWFTKCPPCIQELPLLNKLKEKYADKVNFISITFEDQTAIDAFLKKHAFPFKHIPNSQKQIDGLEISAYPTSFILDQGGIIKLVNSELSEYELKDIETSIDILL